MRRASLGRGRLRDRQLLAQLGFGRFGAEDEYGLSPFELTDEGRAFDDAANVYDDEPEARRLLRDAYLRTPATQALMQGLHGRGAVSVYGALHLLARHGLADAANVSEFRAMLSILNAMGVVAYSVKNQTVRILTPVPDDESPPARIRVVEPERPYSNRRHLRETFRLCRGHVWWADPHFERRGLEPLADEADSTKFQSIRILTGSRPTPADVAEFERFKEEMRHLGITVEVRVVAPPDRTWHDRYIVTSGKAWNVPPIGVLSKGSYSEFSETAPPPFEEWWAEGTAMEDL
jgi:hypothetical protein